MVEESGAGEAGVTKAQVRAVVPGDRILRWDCDFRDAGSPALQAEMACTAEAMDVAELIGLTMAEACEGGYAIVCRRTCEDERHLPLWWRVEATFRSMEAAGLAAQAMRRRFEEPEAVDIGPSPSLAALAAARLARGGA